jgi:hypothetical protein
MNIDHTADFATWWSQTFPGTQCPPLPKKRGDLGLTAEIALQSDAPALFQNLFSNGGLGSGSMPADTVARRNSGQLLSQHIPHLRAAGLEWEAQELQQRVQRQMDQAVQERIAETSHDRWARMLSNPPSPQAIAAARAAWGVTGD